MRYTVNKGIDHPAEFKGLKAQYLVMFAVGLLVIFVLFVILYVVGIPQGFCLAFMFGTSAGLIWITFYLNRRFGPHGIMKLIALHYRPRFIINRKSIFSIIRTDYEKYFKGDNAGK